MKARGERRRRWSRPWTSIPTLCELAGLPAPAVPQKLDGRSFARRCAIRIGADARSNLPRLSAQRAGRRGPSIGRAVRTARHRLVEWKKPGAAPDTADLELYDYETDPAETRNLARDQPSVVAELRALLTAQGEAKAQLVAAPGTIQAVKGVRVVRVRLNEPGVHVC